MTHFWNGVLEYGGNRVWIEEECGSLYRIIIAVQRESRNGLSDYGHEGGCFLSRYATSTFGKFILCPVSKKADTTVRESSGKSN